MIHFYHDPYPFIPYYLMTLYFVGNYPITAINYMTFYLTHTYTDTLLLKSFTNYSILHLSLIEIRLLYLVK